MWGDHDEKKLWVCLGLGVLTIGLFLLLKWNDLRYGNRKGLPPGTMGWPLFGQTLQFLKQGPHFMTRHKSRYGNMFRTHILGSPTVISMDAETNRFLLMNEDKGIVPGYPKANADILGAYNIAYVDGSIHKHIRGSLMSVIGPNVIRYNLIHKLDRAVRSFLSDWQPGNLVDLQDKTKEMALFTAFILVVEAESPYIYRTFKQEFDQLALGTFSLPINFSGTKYHRALKARKRVISMMKQVVKERRASSATHNDILGEMMNDNSKYRLGDDEIFDQIITLLYSGYETVSTTTMMAIKYLKGHPKALQQIIEENLTIRNRKNENEPIDWDDYKSMHFTHAVIYETSRLATIVNGVLRKTKEDLEVNGFIVPKGWNIYVYTREINYDPTIYPDPLSFNPWRWLKEKGVETHNYCFLFGAGSRLCPGKEWGLVVVSLFLHYFLTHYRWEDVGATKFEYFPRVIAPKGFPVKLSNL